MPILPQPLMQIPSRLLRGMVIAALLVLPGCANGDFGEIKPSLVRDDIHDWVAVDAIAGRSTLPSQFELTDDERQLRNLAYPLIEPAYDRQQPNSILGEYGVIVADHHAVFDRTAYAARLQSARYRSPAARYARLIDDIRNDSTRIPPFFEAAARVLDVDGKRQKSLAYVSALSDYERTHAVRRMRENLSVAKLVHVSLGRRLSSYRFALERLVIITPSSQAVEVERTLNQLQAQIARYRFGAQPGRTRPAQIAIAR
jgi:hypothetical protein